MDSAASNNYENSQILLTNIKLITNELLVHLTNDNTILLLHTGTFKNLLSISNISKQCQICPQHKGPTLLSLGKLCNNNYIPVADKNKCIIYKDKPVLRAQ